MFRAIALFMEGNQDNHKKYRQATCNYMRKNRQDYEFLYETPEELEDHIQTMEKDHVWGGEPEISILSKLYNCIFIIHSSNRPNITVNIHYFLIINATIV